MEPENKMPEIYVGDASEDESTNPTTSPTLREVAAKHLSRRSILQGSLAVAATGFLAPAPADAGGWKYYKGWKNKGKKPNKGKLVDFRPLSIEEATADGGRMVTISKDYEYQTLIPWGTPIQPYSGITPYDGDPGRRPTADEQAQMIGIGHDGMFFYPINLPTVLRIEARRGRRLPSKARNRILSSRYGYICINHEFGNNVHVTGKEFPENLEDVRLSQHAHGVSVVAVRENWRGHWQVAANRNNRRITVNTKVGFSGPVAGSPLLDNVAGNDFAGTVNNCGSGETPWGTYLTCEENFNGYFGSTRDDGTFGGFDALQDEAYGRYGFSNAGFGYGWHVFDPRFDLSNPDYVNESNRFGWIVEIDPFNRVMKPVKRTALGRFKHEAAAVKELDDGRVAVYMGDDQRGDYCYKYESNKPWRNYSFVGPDHPLDDGKLYVAVFEGATDLAGGDGKGVGKWVELTIANTDIQNAGLTSPDEVLVYTRLAADAVGATRMDRPEWTTIGTEGEVYWTLTNNTAKDTVAPKDGPISVNEVNPIFNHADGHIIRTVDVGSAEFEWEIFILARNTRPTDPETDSVDENGNPLDFEYAAYTSPADGGENTFTDPDAAWADPDGRLFIGTDGGQPSGLQDQLVVFDTDTGEYRRLLMGVQSDEITGITVTPDYGTLFTNTQHPGNGDPTRTSFPAPFGSGKIPRDCTIVVRRKNGGDVGS